MDSSPGSALTLRLSSASRDASQCDRRWNNSRTSPASEMSVALIREGGFDRNRTFGSTTCRGHAEVLGARDMRTFMVVSRVRDQERHHAPFYYVSFMACSESTRYATMSSCFRGAGPDFQCRYASRSHWGVEARAAVRTRPESPVGLVVTPLLETRGICLQRRHRCPVKTSGCPNAPVRSGCIRQQRAGNCRQSRVVRRPERVVANLKATGAA